MRQERDLKKQIRVLQGIVSRKGSGKVLTFGMPHVLKAFQLLMHEGFVSRAAFCEELQMGEGAVKTLISHLKEAGMADSARSGTRLTGKGRKFFEQFDRIIKNECRVQKSELFPGRYNHAVVLSNHERAIKTGVEQRDFAIMYGAAGCATMLYKNRRFIFPGEESDCFEKDRVTRRFLLESLAPEENDAIIVSSADDPFVAEISAKNSVLCTLAGG